MVSAATDINPGPEFGRVTNPDMALGHSSDPNNTMASVDSPGHPNQPGYRSGIVLGYQHGHKLYSRLPRGPSWQHGPGTSTQTPGAGLPFA